MKKLKLFFAALALLVGGAISANAYDYSMSFDLTGKGASDWSTISPTVTTAAKTYEVAVNNTAGYLLVWGWQTGSQGVFSSSNYLAVRNLTKDAKVTLTLAESSQVSNLTLTQNADKITRVNDGNDIIFTVNDANVHIIELQASGQAVVTKFSLSFPIPATYSYNLKGLAGSAWTSISPTVVGNTRTYGVAVNNTDANMLVWGWSTGSGGVSADGNWLAVRNLSQGDVVDFTFAESSSPSNVTLYTNGDASQVTSSIGGKNLIATVVANRRMFEMTPTASVTIENVSITRNKADLTNYIKNPIFVDDDKTDNGLSSLSGWSFTKSGGNSNIKTHVVEMWNNTFNINQELTNLPNGYYQLSLKATSKDGKGELYAVSDEVTYKTALTKTSTGGNFGDIVTEINKSHGDEHRKSVNAFVSDGTMTIGVRQTESHNSDTWIVFSDFSLTYVEPTLSCVTKPLPISGDMEAGVWYYYDINKAGEYSILASTLGDIIYSTDKNKPMSEADLLTDNYSTTSNLLQTRYYVKSSTDNHLVFDANEKEYIVGDVTTTSIADNAYIQELTTVTFSFGDANTNDGTATLKIQGTPTAALNDGSSDVAEGALSIDAKVVTATFTSVTLDPSKTYTITLPANAIAWDKNTTNKNSEKVITFKTPAVFDGHYYIKKDGEDLYFSRGGDENKQTVLDAFGIPVQITTSETNVSRVKFVDTGLLLGASGSSTMYWTDKGTGTPAQIDWTITKSGEKYKFYLMGMSDDKKGMNIDGSAPKSDTEANACNWELELPAAHPAKLQAVKDAQAAAVATAMGFDGITTQAQMKTYLKTNYGETPIAITGTGGTNREAWQQTAPIVDPFELAIFAEETVSGLAPGLYRLRVYAFERIAGGQVVYDAGGAAGLAYVYATSNSVTEKVKLASLFDVQSDTPWKSGNDLEFGGKYYANGQEGAQNAFNAGKYANDVYVKVVDEGTGTGSIKFGIKQPNAYYSSSSVHNNSQWICYNNFSLVMFEAKPTDSEKTALASEISAAEAKTLGFMNGEYAPYNNVAALELLAAAKAIDPETASGSAVVAATTALNSATWNANADEVNAIYWPTYDGSSLKDASNRIFATGWSLEGVADATNIRIMNDVSSNTGLAAVDNNTAVFGKFDMTYGETNGYTMPLKANTIYRLSFKYGGWNESSSTTVKMIAPDDSELVIDAAIIVPEENKTGHTNTAYWWNWTGYFVAPSNGNYILKFKNNESGQHQKVIGNLSLVSASELVFADGSVPTYAPGTYPSVKISRDLTADRWATAVYPFTVPTDAGVTVATLTSFAGGQLDFSTSDASTANKPFLMKSTTDKSEITLSDVAVIAAVAEDVVKGDVTFTGKYAATPITNEAVSYVLSNNTLYKVGTAGATINPYRAYFTVAESSSVKALSFVVDGTATGIDSVEATEAVAEEGTLYNTAGQQVTAGYKGIVIKNGKKYYQK